MIKITFFNCFLVRELQLENVDIIVADISTFEMEASYDRIFSIEMFEVRFCR
jgi:cyclopropane fatty-acyl-phospholipid synthase-like methyltransferase